MIRTCDGGGRGQGVYDGIGRVDVGEVRAAVDRWCGGRRGEIDRHGGGSIHQGMQSRGETRSRWRPGSAGRHNNTCRNRYKDMK